MSGNYRYKLFRTGSSSDKFGNCEICNKPSDSIYYQIEEREYQKNRWTHYKCFDHFGHKDCLISIRKCE